ncbi:M48 family metallopeptidase [Halosquirtibacter xylanolyticus]|uniref:M48 family metallopeptidase n=1 Tax=Halosquirtibacter xylanolyticus TaxID=3374599 RepID=UPI0037490D12|nr:M48 family metallopeptidase [Prolixibacteraceae bacterium]
MIETKTIEVKDLGLIKIRRGSTKSTIRCSFKQDGSILMGTPPYISWGEINDWIESNRSKLKAKLQQPRPKTDAPLPDLWTCQGHTYKIEYREVTTPKIENSKDYDNTTLLVPKNLPQEKIDVIKKQFLNSAVKIEAWKYLPIRLDHWSETLKLTYHKCFIKNNKTNWGSCSSLGNINLNQHLMRLPSHLIDMVIIHELTHTIIPNHGKDFKAAMQKMIPNIKQLDQEIKQYHPHRW